ncbi:MAG: crosslink repair DNA glycosylase YcaQ family protein [Terracoccus sp.]
MPTSTEASVTWAQALSWRMERHFLDPVGSPSVAAVVRRLGAVLSMDESFAELALATRCATSHPLQLAKALAEGEAPGLPAPEAGLRRGRWHADQAADVAGGHESGPASRRAPHVSAPRHQPTLGGHPGCRQRGSPCDCGVPAHVRAGDTRPPPLLARQRAERGKQAAHQLVLRARDRPVAVDVEGTTAYVVREDVDALDASLPSQAVRFLPGHDQWVMGPGTKDVHVTPAARRERVTRKANPVIAGGVVCGTWARKGDELTVTWPGGWPSDDEPIVKEAARLAGILDRDLRLRLTT